MKALIKYATLSLFVLFFAIAASAQVKSDYDKNVDFTKYKTYAFGGWQKNSDSQINTFDKERITGALKAEFDKRGMTLTKDSANADVAIVLYIVLDPKTSTTAYTDYMGGMGYGAGWGWGMGAGGMGTATTQYVQSDYTEGTLVVDMYDLSTKKLAWQGVLNTVVKESPKKREKTTPKLIAKLMKQYPVKAAK